MAPVRSSWAPRIAWLVARLRALGTLRGLPLLVLLAVDLAVGCTAFSTLPVSDGVWAWGDLPGFYLGGGIPPGWLGSLAVYPLLVAVASGVVGQTLGENLVYLSVFLIPSFGIYSFLTTVSNRKLTIAAVAVVFGTILSPVYVDAFSGGAFEYGLMIFFGFLSFRYAWLARGAHPLRNSAIAGLCFALGLTQVGGESGLEYFGALIVGVFVLPILLLSALRQRNSHSPVAYEMVAAFFATWAIACTPIILGALVLGQSVMGGSTQSPAVHAFVASNISFTYRHYGLASYLLVEPLTLPNLDWTPSAVLPWTLLVVAAVAIGVLGAVELQDERKWIARWFTAVLFGTAAFGQGVTSGALVPLFFSVPILQLLDNPFPILVMLTIPLPVIFILGVEGTFGARNLRSPSGKTLRGPSTAVDAKTSRKSRTTRAWRRLAQSDGAVAAAVFCVGVVVLASYSPNLSLTAADSPAAAGVPIYEPLGLSQVSSWYSRQNPLPAGDLLVFPNTASMYPKAWAAVPQDRVWAVPYAQNVVNSSYNTSLYFSVLSLLVAGQGTTFATEVGLAGVQWIAVLNQSGPIVISPNSIGQEELTMPNSAAVSDVLSTSGAFVLVLSTGAVQLYRNLDYVPSPSHFSNFVDFGGPSVVRILNTTGNALENANFSDPSNVTSWDRYPQQNVTPGPNSSARLLINGKSPTAYANFAGILNLSVANNLENTSASKEIGKNISLGPSGVTTTLQIHASMEIPLNATVQVFLYWYNVSIPGGLFTEYTSTYLGQFNSSSPTVNCSSPPPGDARSGRLFFFAFAKPGTGLSQVLIASPSVKPAAEAVDDTMNASAQLAALSDLNSSGALGSSFLALPYPYAAPNPELGIPSVWVAGTYSPLSLLVPNSALTAYVDLTSWRGLLREGSDIWIAVAVAPVRDSRIVMTEGNNSTSCSVTTSIAAVCQIEYQTAGESAVGPTIGVSGEVVINRISVLSTSSRVPLPGRLSIALPIGSLSFSSAESGLTLERVPVTGSSGVPTWVLLIGNWIPLVALLAIAFLIIVPPTLRGVEFRRDRMIER